MATAQLSPDGSTGVDWNVRWRWTARGDADDRADEQYVCQNRAHVEQANTWVVGMGT